MRVVFCETADFVLVQFLVNISKKFNASPCRLDLTVPGIGVLREGWPLRSHLEAGLTIPPGGWPLRSHLEAGPCDTTWWLAVAIPPRGWPLRLGLEAGPCDPKWRLALAIPTRGWLLRFHLEAGPCYSSYFCTTWQLALMILRINILPGGLALAVTVLLSWGLVLTIPGNCILTRNCTFLLQLLVSYLEAVCCYSRYWFYSLSLQTWRLFIIIPGTALLPGGWRHFARRWRWGSASSIRHGGRRQPRQRSSNEVLN